MRVFPPWFSGTCFLVVNCALHENPLAVVDEDRNNLPDMVWQVKFHLSGISRVQVFLFVPEYVNALLIIL